MVRLSNSLALSGNFSLEAKKDLEDYIATMEQLSGVDDAVIAGNLAMLSSLTRLDADGLKRAQSSALDLSAALGKDLSTANDAIAKAINGNGAGLQRMGIQLDLTKDKTKNLEIVTNALNERFGGASAGAMNTFAGAIKSLRTNFGNLFQSLGDVVVKNNVVIAVVKDLSKILFDLTTNATKAGNSMRDSLGSGIIMTLKGLVLATEAADTFVRVMEAGLRTLLLPINALADSLRFVVDVLDGSLDNSNVFEHTKNQWEDLNKAVSGPSMLGNLSDMFTDLLGTAQGAMYGIQGATVETTASIENQTSAVKALSAAEQARAAQAEAFAKQLFDQAVSVTDGYKMQQEALQLAYENDLINFETYKSAKLQSQLDFFEQQRAMLEKSNLDAAELALARQQLDQEQALARMKLQSDLAKQEEAINKARLQGYSTFFGGLASLQNAKTKELAAIGKAGAITQATIDAYLAIQNALARVPYPANIAAAAGIGAQAFANVSKIAGIGLQRGMDSVPGVGTQDNFPAVLAPGERVVPAKTNEDLTEFLKTQQQQPQQQITFHLNFSGPVWSNKAEAGAEIIDAINEAFDRGMGLRLRNA
jgi:hypothetical protein